ncbi:MAG: cation:dicarboxylase symporter family transporter [Eubacteriales bacterium]
MQGNLTFQRIDEVCKEIQEFLAEKGLKTKEVIKLSFAVEEVLLQYRESFGEEQVFSMRYSKRWGVNRITIDVPNQSMDPFIVAEEEAESVSSIMRNLCGSMGLMPTWKYVNGYNSIVIHVPKPKKSPIIHMCASIILGVVLGMLCNLLPEYITSNISLYLMVPIFNVLMGIITAVAGPMIFLSVVWGIYNIGDTATLSKIGKLLIGRYLLYTLFLGGMVLLAYLPSFQITLESSAITLTTLSSILDMFLDMIPNNFFAPFVEGNPMQIIVIAFVVGFIILVLGDNLSSITELVEQGNYMIQHIMKGITKILPIFIFVSVFNIIIQREYYTLISSYKSALLVLLGTGLIVAIYCVILKIRVKMPIIAYLRGTFTSVLISLTTGSSAAAFPESQDICMNKLGVPKKLVDFGLPLGQVIYMPGCMVVYLAAAFVMAESYTMEMTIVWLFMGYIACVIVSIATPPVAGGALTGYTIIFTQLGIPTEAIAVALIASLFLEMIGAALNVFCVQSELVLLAHSVDMLEEHSLNK